MTRFFGAVLGFNIAEPLRRGGILIASVSFFTLTLLFFPLALGPDAAMLRPLAPALVSAAALLASFLPLEQLFARDRHDGTLEAVWLSGRPMALYAAGKIAASWLLSGLPICLLSPFYMMALGVPPAGLWKAPLILGLMTGLFGLIGAVGAALSLSARQGMVLLALCVFPLYIPVLVFGAGALNGQPQGFLLCAALFAAALPLCPVGCALVLRWQIRD